MIFSDEEVRLGLARIGHSVDGRFLKQALVSTLQAVTSSAADGGAVLRHEGRRSLALELIKLIEFEPEKDRDSGSSDAELAGRTSKPSRAKHASLRRVPESGNT